MCCEIALSFEGLSTAGIGAREIRVVQEIHRARIQQEYSVFDCMEDKSRNKALVAGR